MIKQTIRNFKLARNARTENNRNDAKRFCDLVRIRKFISISLVLATIWTSAAMLSACKSEEHTCTGGESYETNLVSHWKRCTVCGMQIDSESHEMDDGVITKQPERGVLGEKVYTCKDCGFTTTEELLYEPTMTVTADEWAAAVVLPEAAENQYYQVSMFVHSTDSSYDPNDRRITYSSDGTAKYEITRGYGIGTVEEYAKEGNEYVCITADGQRNSITESQYNEIMSYPSCFAGLNFRDFEYNHEKEMYESSNISLDGITYRTAWVEFTDGKLSYVYLELVDDEINNEYRLISINFNYVANGTFTPSESAE